MLVSIIIPIYNVENYIEECLESVYQQTYPHIEVILVNDCTPDNSMKIANTIISKYKDKYTTTIINHEQNKGISEARNSGMKIAKGEYIYFIDSDDAIMLDAIELLANIAIKYKGVELVEGGHISLSNVYERQNQLQTSIIILKGDESKSRIINDNNGGYIWNILILNDFLHEKKLKFQSKILNEDGRFRHAIAKHISSLILTESITYLYRPNNPNSLTNKITKNHFDLMLDMFYNDFSDVSSYNQIDYFCKFSFNYWNKSWRKNNHHSFYYAEISSFVRKFTKQYYHKIHFYNLILVSSFFLPYYFANLYVKLIWRIRNVLK